MREMFQHRGMRLLFVANLISMVGSGMNAAAVIWYILQATHSEVSLGLLVALQTLPSLVLLPFTGVLIDREDRRHLMMWLDVARGLVILVVAVLALTHHVQVWQLYGMTILVVGRASGCSGPPSTRWCRNCRRKTKLLDSNSLMLAAVQGGWVLAGAVVGFVYNKIGLGGILLLDCATYAVSIACVYHVRKGRVTVSHLAPQSDSAAPEHRRRPLPPRIGRRHSLCARQPAGAAAGHGVGALHCRHDDAGRHLRAAERPHSASRRSRLRLDQCRMGVRRIHQHVLRIVVDSPQRRASLGHADHVRHRRWHCCCCRRFPGSSLTVPIYFVMGSGRGVGGIAIQSEMMEMVPKYFMGRMQNTFFFLASALQICHGAAGGRSRAPRRSEVWLLDCCRHVSRRCVHGVVASA